MHKASTRRRKAYWMAFKVGLSYFWLYAVSKIRGKEYWSSRIKEKNRKNAIRIKDMMLELQGLFIKAGQLISTLSNVLPEEFRAPLEQLQDNVPPHSFETINRAVVRELGKPINELFTRFDKEPLAAASIGQVHRAMLGDKQVVVKIQHPEVDELAHMDLTIIKQIVKTFSKFMKIKGMKHLYEQVEEMIEEELDYCQEAVSMQIIKENLKDEAGVYIPEVYTAYSSKKVLTIEYCEGVKISDVDQLLTWKLDLHQLTECLVRVFCQMILVDGFYHADAHPGNLLVNEQGQIILLDFGAVASLSPKMKRGIPHLIQNMIQQDAGEMVKSLRRLGFISNGEATAKVARKLIDDIQDFIENELELESLNIQDITEDQLRQALKLVNIRELTRIVQIPKEWVLLNRAVVLVGGVVYLLDPDWNPVHTLKPYLEEELIGGKAGMAKMVLGLVKRQVSAAATLPVEVQKVIKKVNQGKVTIDVRNVKAGFDRLQMIGQQMVWLLAFVTSIYFYLLTDSTNSYPYLTFLFQFFGTASFLGFWITLWKTPKGY